MCKHNISPYLRISSEFYRDIQDRDIRDRDIRDRDIRDRDIRDRDIRDRDQNEECSISEFSIENGMYEGEYEYEYEDEDQDNLSEKCSLCIKEDICFDVVINDVYNMYIYNNESVDGDLDNKYNMKGSRPIECKKTKNKKWNFLKFLKKLRKYIIKK
jgi:hypothetical protein